MNNEDAAKQIDQQIERCLVMLGGGYGPIDTRYLAQAIYILIKAHDRITTAANPPVEVYGRQRCGTCGELSVSVKSMCNACFVKHYIKETCKCSK